VKERLKAYAVRQGLIVGQLADKFANWIHFSTHVISKTSTVLDVDARTLRIWVI
jgi:hypothetical protein